MHIYFDWRVDSYTGWGNFGQQFVRQASLGGHRVSNILNPTKLEGMSPLTRQFYDDFDAHSKADKAEVERNGVLKDKGSLFFMALGGSWEKNIERFSRFENIIGTVPVGVLAFESNRVPEEAIQAMNKRLAGVICVSGVNYRTLQRCGLERTAHIIQGVAPDVFCPPLVPSVGSSGHNEKFYIFAGGKLEVRKGQDAIIRAFKHIQKAIPQAVLVTAWHTPYQTDFLKGFNNRAGLDSPLVYHEETRGGRTRRLDVVNSLAANGIERDRIIDLGLVPNAQLGRILRRMDCALFTSRFEGGTNLPAMEAIASGVPTVLSSGSGHLDLLEIAPSLEHFALKRSSPPHFTAPDGTPASEDVLDAYKDWFWPDVDELVENVCRIHRSLDQSRLWAREAAENLSRYSWARQINAIIEQGSQWAENWG